MTAATTIIDGPVASPSSEPAVPPRRTSLDASVQTESRTPTPLASAQYQQRYQNQIPARPIISGGAIPANREADQLELLKYSNVELNNIPQDYLNVSWIDRVRDLSDTPSAALPRPLLTHFRD